MDVHIDPRLGTDLAGYRIEALLGRGGMSVVYLAFDPRLGRRVALKLLSPDISADPRFRERFLRESRIAASLDHPSVIPIYEAGEVEGLLYIAMRYVEGSDLKSALREEGRLQPVRALRLVSEAADALDAAHERGLVHRDVKPGNILITRQGGVEHCYLADFGLTKESGSESGLTETGQFVGTGDYMAPEQIERGQVDGRADVYSLGCVLYECLAGEPPYPSERLMAVLWAHVNAPVPTLAGHPALDPVIARALAKDPLDRYASCRELVAAAGEALGLANVAPPRFSRRRLLLVGGAGALAIAAAAAIPAVLLGGGEKQSKSILPLKGDSLVRIDPRTGELVAAVGVSSPVGVAVGEGGVWVVTDADTLVQIDPNRSATARTIDISPASRPALHVAAGEGAVWIVGQDSQNVTPSFAMWRFDPRSGSYRRVPLPGCDQIPLGANPAGVASGEGAVWTNLYFCPPEGLARIDPSTEKVTARFGGVTGDLVAVGEGWIWSLSIPGGSSATLWRVEPTPTSIPRPTNLNFAPADLAVGEGGAWLTRREADSVVRVDPASGRVEDRITVGRLPEAVAVGAGAVWVANTRDRTVSRIDPRSLDVQTIDVGGIPTDIAVGEGAVWVAVAVR